MGSFGCCLFNKLEHSKRIIFVRNTTKNNSSYAVTDKERGLRNDKCHLHTSLLTRYTSCSTIHTPYTAMVHLLFHHTHIINSSINISMEQPSMVVNVLVGARRKPWLCFCFSIVYLSLFKMCLLFILLTQHSTLSRWFRLNPDTWRLLLLCGYYVASSKNEEGSQSTKRKGVNSHTSLNFHNTSAVTMNLLSFLERFWGVGYDN